MNGSEHTWALVLAGGDGTRLRQLTTDANGTAIPKQYCSLTGSDSMLEETLQRAALFTTESRTVVVVAEQHREWWQKTLRDRDEQNIVVQPRGRGTAIGILLPLLRILNRDPLAHIVLLPSDHYIRDEQVVRHSISRALRRLRRADAAMVLLGITPDEFDPELGYIVPGEADRQGTCTVKRFVEKPAHELAPELIAAGAVWNSFIIAVRGYELLQIFARRYPRVVSTLVKVLRAEPALQQRLLASAYDEFPEIDFSRHIVTSAEAQLRVLAVPSCGWSDLGTPARVAECLARIAVASPRRALAARQAPFLNLSQAQLQFAS